MDACQKNELTITALHPAGLATSGYLDSTDSIVPYCCNSTLELRSTDKSDINTITHAFLVLETRSDALNVDQRGAVNVD